MSQNSLLMLRILTPEGIIHEKDGLRSINVPITDGALIGIRPGHTPLIAETGRGKITFQSEESLQSIELHPGLLDIRDNIVIIYTAGEVSQTPVNEEISSKNKFNRLMLTLLGEFDPKTDSEAGIRS